MRVRILDMGVEVSRLQPPAEYLGAAVHWDEVHVKKFIHFVKDDDQGSFRMTKWKLMEFTGSGRLHEIVQIYGAFEEPGQTSASSIMITVALLLMNQRVSVEFKVGECLAMFDWTGEGNLSFYGLLFMLQACIQALRKLRALDLGREELGELGELEALEAVCREVMGGGSDTQASVEDLSAKMQMSPRVCHLLACLSPRDADAASVMARTGPMPLQSSASQGALVEDAGGAEKVPSESERPTSALSAEPSSKQSVSKEGSTCESEEPPLIKQIAAPGLDMVGVQQSLRSQFDRAEQRKAQAYVGLVDIARDADSLIMEQCWARALGGSLPTLRTAWTAPRSAAPFGPRASPEVMGSVFADWLWLRRACIIEEGRFEMIRSSAAAFGVPQAIASAEVLAAMAASDPAAATALASWMSEQQGVEDTSRAQQVLGDELTVVELRLIQEARGLAAASAKAGLELQNLRRDSMRLEGAVAYIDSISPADTDAESAEMLALRGRVTTLQQQIASELKALAPQAKALADARQKFFTTHRVRAALRSALQGKTSLSSWAELGRQVQHLSVRSSSGIVVPFASVLAADDGDCARTALNMLEPSEKRWRHCEGALLAARSALCGGAIRYELYRHEASSQLDGGLAGAIASSYFRCNARVPGHEAHGRKGGTAMQPWRRALVLESLSGAVGSAISRGSAEDPLIASTVQQLLDEAAGRHLQAPAAAAAGSLGGAFDASGGAVARQVAADPEEEEEDEADDVPAADAAEGDAKAAAEEDEVDLDDPPAGKAHAPQSSHKASSVMSSKFSGRKASSPVVLDDLRFECCAVEATAAVAQILLSDGMASGIVDCADNFAKKYAAELKELEASKAATQLRSSESREAVAAGYVECAQHASSDEVTLGEIASRINRALCDAYGDFFCAEPASAAFHWLPHATLPCVQPHPVDPQPALPFTMGRAWRHEALSDQDPLGCLLGERQRHAAHAVGALRAVELLALAAVRWEAVCDAPEEVNDTTADAPESKDAEDMAPQVPSEPPAPLEVPSIEAFARCAELLVEARMLGALASKRLALVECAMRQLVLPPEQRAPECESASDVIQLAEGIIASHLQGDATSALKDSVEDPRFENTVCARVAKILQKRLPCELAHVRCNIGGKRGSSVAASPPTSQVPALPPIASWWELEPGPLFAVGTPPCPQCEGLARLTWRSFGGADAALPLALLAEHAGAFRAWVLAQHRRLAFSALAQGRWGCLIAQQRWRCARLIAERSWRQELTRQQLGQFAAKLQECLQLASDFLAPLDTRGEHNGFLQADDFEGHTAFVREDLDEIVRDMTAEVFPEHRSAVHIGSRTQSFVFEGLRDAVEAEEPSASHQQDAGAMQQLDRAAEVLDQLAPFGSKAARPHRTEEIEKAAVSCWGTLRASESLRLLCATARDGGRAAEGKT